MRHMAGVRNRYAAEPESDATMTLFARRQAALMEQEVDATLESVAKLRELAGEVYFFCSRAIRLALDLDLAHLVRLKDREITALGDAIAASVVPPYETLVEIELALAEMWNLTRTRSMHSDPEDPRHARMGELLHDPDIET